VTQNNDKKTLTLKSGTLGIKLGEKLAPSSSVKTAAQSAAKGKVVVVTKQTRAGSNKPGTSSSGAPDPEMEKRLHLLKQAEVDRKRREEQQKAAIAKQQAEAELAATQVVSDEPLEQEAVETQEAEPEHHNVMDSTVVETATKTELSKEPVQKMSLDSLLRKGKVKNLDAMYKPARPPKEQTPEPTDSAAKPAVNMHDKKHSHIKQLPPSTAKKKEMEETDVNTSHKKSGDDKFAKKLSVAQVMMMDSEEGAVGGRRRSMASIKRAKEKFKRKMMGDQKPAEKIIREVIVPDVITVQELSNRMAEKTADVVKTLMKLGMMVTVTQSIDADTAELVISEFGHKIKRVTEAELEAALLNKVEDRNEDRKTKGLL
jgi:translation initiation factor IF-2